MTFVGICNTNIISWLWYFMSWKKKGQLKMAYILNFHDFNNLDHNLPVHCKRYTWSAEICILVTLEWWFTMVVLFSNIWGLLLSYLRIMSIGREVIGRDFVCAIRNPRAHINFFPLLGNLQPWFCHKFLSGFSPYVYLNYFYFSHCYCIEPKSSPS